MDYALLARQLLSFAEAEPRYVPLMANASALLFDTLPEINWAGFYLAEEESLLLGPFQGKPACIRIPFGKGVCGTAAAEDRTVTVPDVHLFPGHIACDDASRSEIVIPVHAAGRVAAVLDIDSPRKSRFTEEDRMGLEAFVRILEENILFQREAFHV